MGVRVGVDGGIDENITFQMGKLFLGQSIIL